ncbi:hypothetical protein O7623_25990 [Solwaraspora sp. WMMD791]|uniref:hypothetical protein n=1 Tax=Solwaraspora sp. WMMD791 TaxID=3016086 RepID=UPI00249BDB05|nr:hypothetical protein [Solwaraspora sp. WMMD791]WFE26698.1 hypothetical protein O7623_25990 [Solwaraspora sp. WMMD791]
MIVRRQGPESPLRRAVGSDRKGKISPVVYVAGILSALTIDRGGPVGVGNASACFVGVAVVWIVPTGGSPACSTRPTHEAEACHIFRVGGA